MLLMGTARSMKKRKYRRSNSSNICQETLRKVVNTCPQIETRHALGNSSAMTLHNILPKHSILHLTSKRNVD